MSSKPGAIQNGDDELGQGPHGAKPPRRSTGSVQRRARQSRRARCGSSRHPFGEPGLSGRRHRSPGTLAHPATTGDSRRRVAPQRPAALAQSRAVGAGPARSERRHGPPKREGRRPLFSASGWPVEGRLYPTFQAWDGLVGEPLAHVLGFLHGLAGDQKLAFFGRPNADLQMLTPIEVMLAQLLEPRDLSEAGMAILRQGSRRRLDHVAACADRFRQAMTRNRTGPP